MHSISTKKKCWVKILFWYRKTRQKERLRWHLFWIPYIISLHQWVRVLSAAGVQDQHFQRSIRCVALLLACPSLLPQLGLLAPRFLSPSVQNENLENLMMRLIRRCLGVCRYITLFSMLHIYAKKKGSLRGIRVNCC